MYKEWKYYWLTKCINKNHNVKVAETLSPMQLLRHAAEICTLELVAPMQICLQQATSMSKDHEDRVHMATSCSYCFVLEDSVV